MPHFDHFPRPGEMDPYAFRFISNASVFVPEPHPFTRSEIPLELSSASACLEWRGGSSWGPPFCIFPLIFLKWWSEVGGGQWAHHRKSTWLFRYAPLWLFFLSMSLICQTRNLTCRAFLIILWICPVCHLSLARPRPWHSTEKMQPWQFWVLLTVDGDVFQSHVVWEKCAINLSCIVAVSDSCDECYLTKNHANANKKAW